MRKGSLGSPEVLGRAPCPRTNHQAGPILTGRAEPQSGLERHPSNEVPSQGQLGGARMRVRFWGTRGSIAKPGPATIRFGGNTSCVEVRSAAGTLLVLHCRTGAHGLGHALVPDQAKPYRGHILI